MGLSALRWTDRRFEIWLTASLLINGLAVWVMRAGLPAPVRWGLAFDVAITVPALYYLLVVRARLQPLYSLAPLCLLALWRASYVAPGAAWLRPISGAAVEIGLIALVWYRFRRARHHVGAETDPVDRLRLILKEIVPVGAAAEVVASELVCFWYALGSWRAEPHVPAGARGFSVHRNSSAGILFGAVAGLSVVEAIVVHVLVRGWSHAAAWILTALSVYGMVWLVALIRSFGLLPAYIEEGDLVLRNGFLWSLRVPARDVTVQAVQEEAGLRMPPATDPLFHLEFAAPVTVRKIYGLTKRVRSVAVAVDEPAEFRQALIAAGARG